MKAANFGKRSLNRRQFLKLAGAVGIVTVPVVVGLDLLDAARGENPVEGSPYAPVDVLTSWPETPAGASPILILVNDSPGDNPFPLYLGEILRCEGLNSFQIASLSALQNGPLAWYDVIILTEGRLEPDEVAILEKYVAEGGSLIALRPDAALADLLGLDPTGGALSEGYLALDAGHPLGAGLPAETLQFHGTADRYRPAGAEVVAYLADDRESITADPAVTLNRVGAGWAAAWTFDLARSVALTRQGNPALANEEHDGGEGIRAADQFVGWLDTERMEIPQADVQQRLLAKLIHAVSQEKRPVPRLWYFPGEANTMLIATGDSHGNPAAAIEEVLTRVERRGGHFSVYYTAFPNDNWRRAAKRGAYEVADLGGDLLSEFLTAPSPDQIADWRARGHEFGLHPYVEEGLDVGWNRYWNEFTGLGYGPLSRTTRTHRVLWTGWAETARIQAAYGLRMNMDFYHWGPLFKNGRGEWVNGHMTGSGLPMKFVDENGRILEIYQQHTHIADDHLLDLHFGGVAGISIEEALDVMRAIIDRSLAGDFSAVTGQFHVDPFAVGGEHLPEAEKWLDVTLDYAAEKNVPIWSAEEWLRFTEVRHEVVMSQVDWQAESRRLTFSVDVPAGAPADLALMVPTRHGSLSLAGIEREGNDAAFTTREVAGVSYGWLSLPAGLSEITAHYTN